MDHFNLRTTDMRQDAFTGSTAREAGIWLKLMLYCVATSNHGRICGCDLWSAKQWLKTIGLDEDEVPHSDTSLWTWQDGDLTVWNYPHHNQSMVDGGKNQKGGGRPKKEINPSENPSGNPSENPKGKVKGKVREEKEEVKEKIGAAGAASTPSQPDSSSISSTEPAPEKKEGGAGVPVTVEEALTYAESYSKGNAEMLIIEDASVRNWFDDRSTCNWEPVRSGVQVPITDWRADLRKWARGDKRNGYSTQPAAKKEKAVPLEDEPANWRAAWVLCYGLDMSCAPGWHGLAESVKTDLRIAIEDLKR